MRARISGKTARRGVGLVELLVMVAGGSVLLGTATVLIGIMFRSEQNSTRMVTDALATDRAARQFRQDAHAALKAEVDPARIKFIFNDERQISYAPADDRLIRTSTSSDGRERRDEFRVVRGVWTFGLSHEGRLAELDCTRVDRTQSPEIRIPAVHIEAAVGRRSTGSQPSAPGGTP